MQQIIHPVHCRVPARIRGQVKFDKAQPAGIGPMCFRYLADVIAYGFKRVSMADIAQEAGISRPAIYQSFRNKNDVFFSCLDMLVDEAFAAADAAIDGISDRKAQVSAYLLAYMGYFRNLLVAGVHGQGLPDVNNRLGAEKSQAAQARFVARLNSLMGWMRRPKKGRCGRWRRQGSSIIPPIRPSFARVCRC